MNTACILCPEESVTVNSRKAFGLARKRNQSGSPLYSVRGGSASVSNDAVQGGRSPRIYGFSLHLHHPCAYLIDIKENFDPSATSKPKVYKRKACSTFPSLEWRESILFIAHNSLTSEIRKNFLCMVGRSAVRGPPAFGWWKVESSMWIRRNEGNMLHFLRFMKTPKC